MFRRACIYFTCIDKLAFLLLYFINISFFPVDFEVSVSLFFSCLLGINRKCLKMAKTCIESFGGLELALIEAEVEQSPSATVLGQDGVVLSVMVKPLRLLLIKSCCEAEMF